MRNTWKLPIFVSCTVAVVGFMSVGRSHADDQGHSHSHTEDAADHEHSGEVLAYRLEQTKTLPFDDPQIAAEHLAAVKKLGCEAQQSKTGARTEVAYRCVQWKTMTVTTHELSEQWEAWLKAAGFDCFHGHVAPELLKGPEVVELRLLEWRTIHAEGPQAAQLQEIVKTLRTIGSEVQHEEHDGHADARYRCPVWTDIHLPDHAAAEQYITFLKAQGFETRHTD